MHEEERGCDEDDEESEVCNVTLGDEHRVNEVEGKAEEGDVPLNPNDNAQGRPTSHDDFRAQSSCT